MKEILFSSNLKSAFMIQVFFLMVCDKVRFAVSLRTWCDLIEGEKIARAHHFSNSWVTGNKNTSILLKTLSKLRISFCIAVTLYFKLPDRRGSL